ncbi:DEKNAAC103681 [Brettanomyces naardenensis]|uniref:DEKNAAC103681 n=1 Tax=Brettanomyces naardenensis TaxID=13370 RepID=A0A448YNY5_BRENA|nr:DEKNAAC103681 [Brettanomyces naardenensis]
MSTATMSTATMSNQPMGSLIESQGQRKHRLEEFREMRKRRHVEADQVTSFDNDRILQGMDLKEESNKVTEEVARNYSAMINDGKEDEEMDDDNSSIDDYDKAMEDQWSVLRANTNIKIQEMARESMLQRLRI